MKIGILTLKLKSNYGGLLQAYALQTILERLGHEPIILRRDDSDYGRRTIITRFNNLKLKIIRRMKGVSTYIPSEAAAATVKRNTDIFVNEYLYTSPYLLSSTALRKYTEKECFEAYVVGSDQVWRPRYVLGISDFFLDFAKEQDVKRIAYAASFGVDKWEYNKQEQEICARLAKKFDAISVREDTGVELCHDYLGANATHVLDPTLLLDKEDYIKIIKKAEEKEKPGNMFCYVLDDSKEFKATITDICSKYAYNPFYTMPKCSLSKENEKNHLEDCVFPRVSEWLRGFIDAEMVLTDSFHGCVFSIIFHKRFWVIGNESRGLARFESLLNMFGLQNRMIKLSEVSNKNLDAPIDWDEVDRRKTILKDQSMSYLVNALK